MMTCPHCTNHVKAWDNSQGVLIQKSVGLVRVENGEPANVHALYEPSKADPQQCPVCHRLIKGSA